MYIKVNGGHKVKKVKKLSASLMAAGLVTSISVSAFANETSKVDTSNFETVNLQEALGNVEEKTATVEDLGTISTNLPIGYLANNIFALSINLEKISNQNAKAALQKNIDKAIAKWEEKSGIDFTEKQKDKKTPDLATTEVQIEPTKQTIPIENKKAEMKAIKQIAKQERKATRKLQKEQKEQQKDRKKESKKHETK
jgi:hypothetical protein